MVFSEVAGLHNLYAIARFCQSKGACRRAAFFRHFGEQVQDCNGMCDNCAYAKEITELDVTAHAKSLVTLLKDSDNADQKTTMLQLVDSWRSRSRQTEGPEEAALVKELSKEDVERVVIQLVLDGILKEEFSHTAYATNAYVAVGAASRSLMQGKRRIFLEVVKGAKTKKSPGGAANGDLKMQSGMAQMLDALRQQLAGEHGSIFPHSVLSSQHINMLCSRRPDTLDLVEKVVGKRKLEQYGQQILDAIRTYLKEHPEEERDEQTGPWVTPKGAKTSSASQSAQKSSTAKKTYTKTDVSEVLKQQSSAKKSCAAGKAQTARKETRVVSPLKSPGVVQDTFIDLDTESDDEVEVIRHPVISADGLCMKKKTGSEECKGPEAEDLPSVKTEPHGENETKPSTKIRRPDSDDDDDDFVLVRRVRRKK